MFLFKPILFISLFLLSFQEQDIKQNSYYEYYFKSEIIEENNKTIIKENIDIEQSEIILVDYEDYNYVFLGDSRFVGMSNCKESNDTFICKVGEGYNYFCKNISNISENDIVIIGFGVNDLGNIDKYIELANSLTNEVYYLTVNPVDEQKERENGYSVTNQQIDEFNNKLKANATNYKVIDTNSYLKQIGFSTTDGLHYDNATYIKIYEYIKQNFQS